MWEAVVDVAADVERMLRVQKAVEDQVFLGANGLANAQLLVFDLSFNTRLRIPKLSTPEKCLRIV